jgi:branched-chain amino acid transport system permease protein
MPGCLVNWLQFAANGMVVAGILLLGAVGLSLLYGVKRFANFAHGDFMTLGAYLTFTIGVERGLGLWGGAVVAMALVAVLGIALEKGVFDRLRARPPVVSVIAAVGLSFILLNLVRAAWGTQDMTYPLLAETAIPIGLGVHLTPLKLQVIGLAVVVALGVHALLRYTTLGKALRATADNYDLARVTGIPVKRVEAFAWALAGALAALGGVALGALTLLNPNMGLQQLLLIFAAVILGGVGSPYGAMLGALVIGLSMELAQPVLAAAGIAATLSPAVAFAILVGVLLVRPEGIVGSARSGQGALARRLAQARRRRKAAKEVAPPG